MEVPLILVGTDGVELNIKDKQNDTALMYCLKNDEDDIAKILVDAPGIVLNVMDKVGDTPLMYCLKKRKIN